MKRSILLLSLAANAALAQVTIPWTDVSKTGSSLADFTTRSAADLSSGTLPAARLPAFTGDITTTAGSAATVLATVNGNVGSFGSATAAPVVTINAKGLITGASVTTITPAWASVTGKPTTVAASGLADAVSTAALSAALNPIASIRGAVWDSITFDGVSSGGRAVWSTGSQQIGTSDFTLVIPIRSLTRIAGAVTGLFMLSTTPTPSTSSYGGLAGVIEPDGRLRIYIGSDAANRRYIDVAAANWYNLFAGTSGDLIFARTAGVPSLHWVSGLTVTALPTTENTAGTFPAWSDAILNQSLVLGAVAVWVGNNEYGAPLLLNRQWTDTDRFFWGLHRRLPIGDDLSGSMVNLLNSTAWINNSNTSFDFDTFTSSATGFTGSGDSDMSYALLPLGRSLSAGQRVFISFNLVKNNPASELPSFRLNVNDSGTAAIAACIEGLNTAVLTVRARTSTFSFEPVTGGSASLYDYTISNFVAIPLGALIQPEITRTAQILDYGLNRIRGIATLSGRPLTTRPPVGIRGNQTATGFALGLGSADPLWFEPALITGLRIKQASASAQTITLRLNTSGGTTIATATTAASTDWQIVPLAIPGGFEVASGDRLHWTITNALDWDLTWSRR